MAVNYAFPMEGMMGPSTPIDRITAKNSMFGVNVDPVAAATPAANNQTREQLKQKLQRGAQGAQAFLGKYAIPALGAASLIPGVTTALSEINEGRPTGALGALAPGALSAVGTGLAMIPNPIARVAGVGLMGLGALLPGAAASGAESARQSLTGKPTKGKEQEFSTQMAMRGQLMSQNLDSLNRELAIRMQATQDLTTFQNQAMLQQYKAMAPELEKAKMNDFARYQTAMALQGQIQGQLGVLATAGAMAQQGQAGNYGLAQTALTTNPYAGATIQAPQIRFG
jgi:hypothetical protein